MITQPEETTAAYQTVVGLEVHVQLLTQSKLFCRCSTKFGAPPNTQTCPVCTGMPGALPVMNREAFRLSLKTAIALDLHIPQFTKWDRKNYFYPDSPRGYQISQFDLPLSEHGFLHISDPQGAFPPKKIRILRAHLEDDAGKSLHDEAAGKADSRIDLNRAGTPLLEIVSEPDMRSAQEARAYLTELKLLLTYLGVSDCNMQEGSLRVDANVNIHMQVDGEKIATPIVEIKNLNSFRAVERAVVYEAQRQYELWRETGKKLGDAPKQTRGWDDQAQLTRAQRHKEESSDYRYFPDPDLAPVLTSAEEVEKLKAAMIQRPAELRSRLQTDYALDAHDADVIVNQGRLFVDYFIAVAEKSGSGKLAGNWIQQSVLRYLNEQEIGIGEFDISAAALAEMIDLIQSGELASSRAKDVFAEMLNAKTTAPEAMKTLGIEAVDDSTLVTLCQSLLDDNPRIVADVQGGKQQAVGALIGQAKKKNPNANPSEVRKICLRLIDAM